ncbi:MAG: hypothetical protein JNM90_14020 [Burkholderiales bacterium]|nr:hypothetical protein [Burkholderiales bacterium]
MPDEATTRAAAAAVPIPALLIAGGRAARAQAIDDLVQLRPADQLWAVVDSDGAIGAAGRADRPGVRRASLGAGCPCCTGHVAFRVGLARFLASLGSARPARLIIDSPFARHLDRIRAELARPQWARALRLDATLLCLADDDLASAPDAGAGWIAACAQADLVLARPPHAAGVAALVRAAAGRARLAGAVADVLDATGAAAPA